MKNICNRCNLNFDDCLKISSNFCNYEAYLIKTIYSQKIRELMTLEVEQKYSKKYIETYIFNNLIGKEI